MPFFPELADLGGLSSGWRNVRSPRNISGDCVVWFVLSRCRVGRILGWMLTGYCFIEALSFMLYVFCWQAAVGCMVGTCSLTGPVLLLGRVRYC